jgi:hypothetical protein
MAFYQQTRTAKAAAIGTIMPWTGGVSAVPKGWILCDGSQINASAYPLLARAIGDTYNSGPSSFGGSFPNYTGSIVLPALNNKNLIDIESTYFGPTGTGNPEDLDPSAGSAITPLIGANIDTGVKTIYNDITTDVIFTLNDRSGYSGRASGNTISGGDGVEKTVYISPRKLGRDHIKTHNHPGRHETLSFTNPLRPGVGVIPYSTFSYEFRSEVDLDDNDETIGKDRDTEIKVRINMIGPKTRDSVSGFGQGQLGRVVAAINAENPTVNYTPFNVARTPIQPILNNPRVDSNTPIPYGILETNINVGSGQLNYYPDISNSFNQANTYDTLVTPPANSFNKITQSPGVSDVIQAHLHDEFDVRFVRGTLRPNTNLVVDVTAPSANLNLDNQSNKGVLQINFNTTQPGVTCIYIIRAY